MSKSSGSVPLHPGVVPPVEEGLVVVRDLVQEGRRALRRAPALYGLPVVQWRKPSLDHTLNYLVQYYRLRTRGLSHYHFASHAT